VRHFLLGSLPLWTYNAHFHWATFRGNFHREFSEVGGGWCSSRRSTTGVIRIPERAMIRDPAPHRPSGPVEKASAWIAAISGDQGQISISNCVPDCDPNDAAGGPQTKPPSSLALIA